MLPPVIQTGTPTLPSNGTGLGVAWSPDGAVLAVLSSTASSSVPTLFFYDTSDWSLIAEDYNAGWQATKIAWTPDGNWLVVTGVGYNYQISQTVYEGFAVYDRQNNYQFSSPFDISDLGEDQAFTSDGQYLLVLTQSYVHVIETVTWQRVARLNIFAETDFPNHFALSSDDTKIAIAQRSAPRFALFDFDKNALTLTYSAVQNSSTIEYGREVCFNLAGDKIFCSASSRTPYFQVYDVATGAELYSTSDSGRRHNWMSSHVIDGQEVILGYDYVSGIAIIDVDDYSYESWAPHSGQQANYLSFSPNNEYMAVAVSNPGVTVYGPVIPTGDISRTLDNTTSFVDMRYGTDYLYDFMGGATLASTGSHGVAANWNVSLEATQAAITGETFSVLTLAATLEATAAAMAGVHEPTVRKVTMAGTFAETLTSNYAVEDFIRAAAAGTVTTFYNPQEEPVLAGVATLGLVVAYVESAVLAGTGQLTVDTSLAAAQWLAGRGAVTVQTDLQRLFEDTLTALAGDSAIPAFAELVNEVGQSEDSEEVAVALQLMDSLAASLIQQATMTVVVSETLEAEAGDSVEALGTYTANVKDMAGAWLVFKVSGEVVQGWVMNVEGDRPFSEYSEFDFNSMTRIGNNYFAAADDGLYSLGADTDAGAQIDARVSSMMLDFDTTAQKRVVAAYLGYTSDGTVVLKVRSVDDGRLVEHWYEATEVTADAPREGYRPLGRGLKSRYWQFEIANVDGADFEIDKLELQPIKLRRRV